MDAIIFPSSDVCMNGRDLRRLRIAACLSERELANRMDWYRKKVQRLESSNQFCLNITEMRKLLLILEFG
jgi:transcriptional regulator with XRE-family HTH domain